MNQIQLIKALRARIGILETASESSRHEMTLTYRTSEHNLPLLTVKISCNIIRVGTGTRVTIDENDWQIMSVTGCNAADVFAIGSEGTP